MSGAPKFCIECGGRLAIVREEGRTRRRCRRCGWTFYGNPVPAAVALIMRGGRLLLTRRARPPYAGTWDLPGGFLEAGNAPRRACGESCGRSWRWGSGRLGSSISRWTATGRRASRCSRWFPRRAIPYREIAFPGLRRFVRRWVSDR